ADRRPVVADDGEVDVGLLGPALGGLEDDVLPGRGRAELRVERREEVAGDGVGPVGGDVGAVGDEADGDQLGGGPGVARDGVGDQARFELFEAQTVPAGGWAAAPGGAAPEASQHEGSSEGKEELGRVAPSHEPQNCIY